MRQFLFVTVLSLLCFEIADVLAQTNATIPGPENVLVVYRLPDPNDQADTISRAIKDYYVNARGIPSITNVLGLPLPSKVINLNDGTGDHVVELNYHNEHIWDATWAPGDTAGNWKGAKFHTWLYFLEEVATKIKEHLENNNLTETIRYIVMCQGVPYKLLARGEWSSPANISVDGLLCMLNTANYDDFIQDIYDYFLTQNQGGDGWPFINNPYYDEDSNFDFDSRFLSDYYTGTWGGHNYKLSYLVSRLDGLSFNIIKDMIDKSVDADKSGINTWILDGGAQATTDASSTYTRLNNLGFTTEFDNTYNWIVSSQNPVIGYMSPGTWQNMPASYIQTILNFNYANGSIFNTYESYNGNSIGTLKRRGGSEQGLITEFMLMGGTAGAANILEPSALNVMKSDVYFPYYAMGYNQIDAA